MASMLGLIGVAFAWGLVATQYRRAISSVAAVSVTTWTLFLVLNIAWLTHAVHTRNWFLVANAVGSAVLNAALLRRLGVTVGRASVVVAASAAVAAGTGTLVSWQLVPLLCVVVALTLRWPQVAKIVTTRSIDGVSLSTWTLATVTNLVWVAIAASRDDRALGVSNAMIAATNLAVIGAYMYVRRAGTAALSTPASTGM